MKLFDGASCLAGITHTKEHKALVAVLIACRKEAGLTQEALGKRLRWDRQTVSQVETGVRSVEVAELPKICKALQIDEMSFYERWLVFRKSAVR